MDFRALWNVITSKHLLAYDYQKGVSQRLQLGTWFFTGSFTESQKVSVVSATNLVVNFENLITQNWSGRFRWFLHHSTPLDEYLHMIIRKGYLKRFNWIDPLSCMLPFLWRGKVHTLHTWLKELDVDYESASKMMLTSNHMSCMQMTNRWVLVMTSPKNLRYSIRAYRGKKILSCKCH